ncbi:hypothetical protein [Zunongwangia sp. HGR-M22]|uniref:hypothetical protein n=1 Tax=Zunongwangia sp. HGR-M22 TaxID=3015168 RepID=UPI0022DE9466|nr:hypothetical protein [Zunongwangia sp. HGR-M22]WBL26774.1 hypothetical protein PBT91_05800 [Zunongwangia sp. HGR-M22]
MEKNKLDIMDNFKKRTLNPSDFHTDDSGIDVNRLLTLISESEYISHLNEYFDLNNLDEKFINIKGSSTLFTILKSLNSRFTKIDLKSNLKNIEFDYKDQFGLLFNNLNTNEYFEEISKESIKVIPIHSGERDFFSHLYNIDRYASSLLRNGYNDILSENLERLKSKAEHIKRYRLIHDTKEDNFYLRAIISEDRYFDYNNDIAFVIALLKLHYESLISDVKYEIAFCEFNESAIRIFFKTTELKEIQGVGYLQNTIQVSNDETKKEALKFSTVASISFKNKNNEDNNIYIKPKDIKTKVLTINHGTGPEKAFYNLNDFAKSKEVFETLYDDVKVISKIKDHGQILHLIRIKIENSNTEEIKKNKEELKKLLMVQIKNTAELLETFNKLIMLEGLEIDGKEYLRYLVYEALIDRK